MNNTLSLTQYRVHLSFDIDVYGRNHAQITAVAVVLIVELIGFIWRAWFDFVDWWNDPANDAWPKLHLPSVGVAGQVIAIVLVSVLFGLGVRL